MGVCAFNRGLAPAAALALLLPMTACENYDPCAGLESAAAALISRPDNEALQECFLARLDGTPPSGLCRTDADGNGRPAAEDLIRMMKARVSQAPSEKPVHDPGRGPLSLPEITLREVASKCPEWQPEASFVELMFKVAQASPPFSDWVSLVRLSTGDVGSMDINKLIGPIISLISPDTPCADKGLAQCGKDVSEGVAALGDAIKGNYELMDTKVVYGTTSVDLSGTYNEPAFRLIAATGELVYGALYFLAAHIDINSLLSEATSLLGGGLAFDFDTAGQALTSLDTLDGLLVKILEGPALLSGAGDKLWTSRAAFQRAVQWITDDPIFHTNILTSLPYQGAERLGVRFIDSGDGRVGSCDQIQVNLGFGNEVFSDYYAEGPQRGCAGPLQPNSFQLPAATSKDLPVNYEAMFAGAMEALRKFDRSITDASIIFSFDDLNLFLNQVGGKSLPKVMEFRPAVLFRDGLRIFTPGRPGTKAGTASALKDYFEMEVNQDTPACPEAKTSDGVFVCKNRKGDKDHSALIVRGDADHFNAHVAKDNVLVSEAILDQYGLGPKTFFRASEGGGFLPYVEFKSPDLKGFLKVDEALISNMTDPNTPFCDREMGKALTGRMAPTDNRFLSTLFNYALLNAKICGNSTLKKTGNVLGCAGLFPTTAAGALAGSCEMDWGCSEDLDCEMDELVPSCGADDFSCRQVIPLASAPGLEILANGFLNVGIVVLPLLVWPLRRWRSRKRDERE